MVLSPSLPLQNDDVERSLSDSTRDSSLNHTLKALTKMPKLHHSTPKKDACEGDMEENDDEEEDDPNNMSTDISDAELSDFWDQVGEKESNRSIIRQ